MLLLADGYRYRSKKMEITGKSSLLSIGGIMIQS
jgi:hypothetical protein